MQPSADRVVDEQVDVVYGVVADEPLPLDVYRPPARPVPPAGHHPRPWRRDVDGSRADMADPARHLARAGYVAFAVDYRLVDLRPHVTVGRPLSSTTSNSPCGG